MVGGHGRTLCLIAFIHNDKSASIVHSESSKLSELCVWGKDFDQEVHFAWVKNLEVLEFIFFPFFFVIFVDNLAQL